MAYCDECGRSIPDEAAECPYCKTAQNLEKREKDNAKREHEELIRTIKEVGSDCSPESTDEILKRIEELEKQQLKYQKSTTTNTAILAFFTLVSVIVTVMTYLQFAGMFRR